eukprot:785021-Amphidinium_carterae.2
MATFDRALCKRAVRRVPISPPHLLVAELPAILVQKCKDDLMEAWAQPSQDLPRSFVEEHSHP